MVVELAAICGTIWPVAIGCVVTAAGYACIGRPARRHTGGVCCGRSTPASGAKATKVVGYHDAFGSMGISLAARSDTDSVFYDPHGDISPNNVELSI